MKSEGTREARLLAGNSRLSVSTSTLQMRRYLRFKDLNERWVHVLKVVWDVEANHPRIFQMGSELRRKLFAVCLFHYKNDFMKFQDLTKSDS
jgi:hypothetical protein